MRGRKRTPAAIAALKGNPGKRPLNKCEPQTKAGRPRCPGWLTESARRHFRRICKLLADSRILTLADEKRIAECAVALAKAEECQRKIAERGYWCEDTDPATGVVTTTRWPWTYEEAKAWEQFSRAAACLGLDPTSRARLVVAPPPERDPLDALIAEASEAAQAREGKDKAAN